jgi:hypothetical protein
MKWNNSEMSIVLREDNIIVVRVNKGVKKLGVPAAKECVAKIQAVMRLNKQPKVLLFYMPNIYVSKDVLRCYADTEFGEAGLAVFCESFTAWLMGNIGVTIRKRFMSSNPAAGAPIKAFKEEDEAMAWSFEQIEAAS